MLNPKKNTLLTFEMKKNILSLQLIMLRIVKHIAVIALCLLVIGGAAGTHIYVFICSHGCHAVQLSLTDDHHCEHSHHACCDSHDDDDEDSCCHDESVCVLSDACCTATSQELSVSNFEVSREHKLSKVAPVVALFNSVFHCCAACGNTAVAVAFPPVENSSHSPDIYSFGQLRL